MEATPNVLTPQFGLLSADRRSISMIIVIDSPNVGRFMGG